MIDFILDLERCLNNWPKNEKWDFGKVAIESGQSVDFIVDIMSNVLNNEYEYNANMTRDDATKALTVLKERMKPQLVARQRLIQAKREKAVKAYDLTMEKVRMLSKLKNWHSAYRTITNFIGSYEQDLPVEIMYCLLNDALRIAVKSGENLQELSRWLKKAVSLSIEISTPESIEEAIDFVDAFSGDLKRDPSGNGLKLLQNITQSLQIPAAQYDLVNQYTALIKDLGMIDGW